MLDKFVSVSVIIPCYCCVETIDRAVSSVMDQTVLPVELLLVDDASSDNGRTITRLHELKMRYANKTHIEIISLKTNGGPSVARNTGWDVATQPYIAFLDADDAWHPRKLEIQYNWMKTHPDVVLVGHLCVWARSHDHNPQLPAEWKAWKVSPLKLLLSNRFQTPSAMLYRNLPFRFIPDKRHCEDYFLWLQIVLRGYSAWRLELPLAYFYKAPFGVDGLSKNLWKMEKGEMDSYWQLHLQGLMNKPVLFIVTVYSLLKYTRRIIIKLSLFRFVWVI